MPSAVAAHGVDSRGGLVAFVSRAVTRAAPGTGDSRLAPRVVAVRAPGGPAAPPPRRARHAVPPRGPRRLALPAPARLPDAHVLPRHVR